MAALLHKLTFTRLDRYLAAQLLATFAFFALVLVAVSWLNRAVLLFSRLVAEGQSVSVVLEMTLLTLPFATRIVLPLAGFAAALYTLHRLAQESELVVMQATGASAWRLARPFVAFGLCVTLALAVLTHVLEPKARERMAVQEARIASDYGAKFLKEGTFVHPVEGMTLYMRARDARGVLWGLFLADRRDGAQEVIYTAERAMIVSAPDGVKLLMFKGMAQRRSLGSTAEGAEGESAGGESAGGESAQEGAGTGRLAVTHFEDFVLTIAAAQAETTGALPLDQRDTGRLWRDYLAAPEAGATTGQAGGARAELHQLLHARLASPLMGLVAALIAYGAMMMQSFARIGSVRPALLALGLMLGYNYLETVLGDLAQASPSRWGLVYAAPAVGLVVALGLIGFGGRNRRPKAGYRARGPQNAQEAAQ